MPDSPDLSPPDRRHLGSHNPRARTGVDGLEPVGVQRDGDAFIRSTTGHEMRVPSALPRRMPDVAPDAGFTRPPPPATKRRMTFATRAT